MADTEIRKGMKTFFLNVDSSLVLDELQLQVFFLGGYEVYPLPESHLISIENQIECLHGLFSELIVFLNIDQQLKGTTWEEVIFRCTGTFGRKVRFGVFHHESDSAKKRKIEETYLLKLEIQAGCIFIPRSRTRDIVTIQRALVANEANGRRKAIRMLCSGRLNFTLAARRYEARILDISISHLTCIFKKEDPQLETSTRISDIQMMVGGPVFNVDAYVLMKRVSPENSSDMVYVFGFAKTDSTELGIDESNRMLLIGLIHRYCSEHILELVRAAFQKRRQHNSLSNRGAPS